MIKNDPSELPSVLINQKAPKFETLSLLSNKKFLYEMNCSKHFLIDKSQFSPLFVSKKLYEIFCNWFLEKNTMLSMSIG